MEKYVLENDQVLVEFLDLGGCITKIVKKSNNTNYVVELDDLEQYQNNSYYFGATIGRNAGRTFPTYYVAGTDEKIILDTNENRVHLHGGKGGLHNQTWLVSKRAADCYELTYSDQHSIYEEMALKLLYKLTGDTFSIEMIGESDSETICNLTNHSYFNLNRDKSETVATHQLKMAPADLQLIDNELIPTGEYARISRI